MAASGLAQNGLCVSSPSESGVALKAAKTTITNLESMLIDTIPCMTSLQALAAKRLALGFRVQGSGFVIKVSMLDMGATIAFPLQGFQTHVSATAQAASTKQCRRFIVQKTLKKGTPPRLSPILKCVASVAL